jgi:hypothetical protein
MNKVPATVAATIRPVAVLVVRASGRISDVARWRRKPVSPSPDGYGIGLP